MRTAIALGSNLGDRLDQLRTARDHVLRLPGVGQPVKLSAVYETEPVDCAPGDPPFLNAVMEADYSGDPQALLAELAQIEHALGRPTNRPRNTPRAIDLDILYIGDRTWNSSGLHLPHPRISERRFVLAPLCDIDSEIRLPGWRGTACELLHMLPAIPEVRHVTATW